MKKSFTQRQIPTLLGLVILIASLIGGILFIGEGGGVFAPRATAQTAPKKVTTSNVKDDSFTISFVTDDATAGFVKYGTTADKIEAQAGDDRDQFSGNVGQFTTHHITIHDLQPATTYYFTLGTTASSKYDNNGTPYSVKTTPKSGILPIAKTIYGTVNTSAGSPAAGSIVYVSVDGIYQLSALTKDSGSWAIPLANARTETTGEYRAIGATDQLLISAQGNEVGTTSNVTVSVADAQPVSTIILGQDQINQNTTTVTTQANNTGVTENPLPTPSPLVTATPVATAAIQAPVVVVEVNKLTPETVETAQPTIKGTAAPNVLVDIEIHSETAINTQVQTDGQGNYTLDLQQLAKQLEPGQHTVTIRYTDPANPSQPITQTKTFTVVSQGLIAAITPSPTPFSTNNPFVLVSPTPLVTATASASPSLVATSSTVISKVSTTSAMPKSGSTTTTFLLIGSGLLFILSGGFSYWVTARQSEIQDLG